MARTTVYRHQVRYFEADQQGVVFNMWYLGYLDEALTAFLADGGLAYRDMLDAGFDVQLVHSEIDWSGPLRWPDPVEVHVRLAARGTTSFRLSFVVRAPDAVAATASTVYVVVATDGSGKRPIPPLIADAIGPAPAPV